jgi:excisionase family DNA binding protein
MQSEGSHRAPIDVPSTAAYIGTNPRHVRNLVARREIPFTKVGRLLRFFPDELDRWLEENTTRAEAS